MPSAFLPDRAFVKIAGPDAEHFLQNLITTDLGALADNELRPGALLTPQGKIFFDFLISRDGDSFLIDIRADQTDAFVRRMTMYKLRAPVTIDTQVETGATVSWGGAGGGVPDQRFALAGTEVRRQPGHVDDAGDREGYDALRVLHGVPESGFDYALQDAFPHDILFDKSGGVSFRKGCYVGQEVVSRMQHRATARRRVVIVSAETALPASGTDITIGGKQIGALGTVAGSRGLAIVRIDKAGEAINAGEAILAGEVPVTLALPGWSGLSFPTASEEA
ncbi:YgfZ/GcvT domain-containing protein [Rhizobium sp. 'Codium 1']|uniref:CAF17-like 4Fe-4S cluster assembly/insertion protein YgfZ n=1 Tax=Rhizobium sp. 'Codium 1' TaxID=2940484 RepID=UPI001E5AB338|nr:folate-binding protein YgfZ [Rhizobium sp. 'Codium 1']MCC8933685.1 folate-binding protein YgfZ [Rhizobium sp. 'Codium 1']